MSERLPAPVTHLSARCFLSAPTGNSHTRNPQYADNHAHTCDTWQKNGTYPMAKLLTHRYTWHTWNELEISSQIPNNNSSATSSPDSYPHFCLTVLTLSLQPSQKNSVFQVQFNLHLFLCGVQIVNKWTRTQRRKETKHFTVTPSNI